MDALAGLSVTATVDSFEPDNTVELLEAGLIAGNDVLLASGVAQTHSISPAGDVDYVKFHLDATSSITLVTGGAYALDDTVMWLYDSAQHQLDYNDDRSPTNWHSYIQRCGPTALPAGDYYARVGKRGNDAEIAAYSVIFTINPLGPTNCIPNTTVTIPGAVSASYWIHQETTTLRSYPGKKGSPVRVRSNNGVKPLVASMGVSLKKTAGYESYSEFIGMPSGKLSNTYWFPWYVNSGAYVSQLCFGNVGSQITNVTVKIGTLAPVVYKGLGINRAKCVSYPSVNTGPVKVLSSATVIVASLNTMLKNNANFTSYDEFGGLSASDSYSTDYMFPFYGNLTAGTTVSQLRFANIGTASTTVTLTVQGVPQPTKYTLLPNTSRLVALTNVNRGPVHVTSNGQPITASMIVKLKSSAPFTSYSEFIGLPETTLNQTRFVFPWYNSSGNLVSQLRVTNIGTTRTDVTVTIAGITKSKVSLLPRQSKVVSYAGLNTGPVVLQSSNKIPIVASMITSLKKTTGYTSYSEFIGQAGLPRNQLLPVAWFPWYGNDGTGGVVSQLRIALPAKP